MPAVSDSPDAPRAQGQGMVPLDTAGSLDRNWIVERGQVLGWLHLPDPYTGQPWHGTMQGPVQAGIVLQEAWHEPHRVEVIDPKTGYLVKWALAPMFRCWTCGQDTTRSVPYAGYIAGDAGENYLHLAYRAECPSCGQRRHQKRLGSGLVPPQPEAADQPKPRAKQK